MPESGCGFPPPVAQSGVGGWTKDGKSVLLYDKFDVWEAPLDGGKPTNLTAGVGRAQQIQFRVTRFGGAGGRG